jgi:opacity protein-like surface antigen
MRTFLNIILTAAVVVTFPGAASAQRVPTTDSGAIGGEVGLYVPTEEGLDPGPTLEGFYEYYFAPRGSIRVGVGWSRLGFENRDDFNVRMIRVPVDFVYNWEGGAVHPFVGAGLGAYFLQRRLGGQNFGDSETKLGLTLFGGAEFFTSRTAAVKAEGRYHSVRRGSVDPDGLSLTIGLKKYF